MSNTRNFSFCSYALSSVIFGVCGIKPTIQMSEGMKTTQFVGNYLEERGLIKMDFLGLKNLTTIDEIVQMIHKHHPDFHILSIPLNDSN